MIYEIKIHHKYFSPLFTGKKTFDLMKDKGFKVGDIIRYREYSDMLGSYTGMETRKEIVYRYEGQGNYGLAKGYVILALKDVV